MGQRVNEQEDIREVSKADIVSEATRWGLRRKASAECVSEVLDAMNETMAETDGDESVLDSIRRQLARAGAS
jgi:serine/threonine-protein kinase HipA